MVSNTNDGQSLSLTRSEAVNVRVALLNHAHVGNELGHINDDIKQDYLRLVERFDRFIDDLNKADFR